MASAADAGFLNNIGVTMGLIKTSYSYLMEEQKECEKFLKLVSNDMNLGAEEMLQNNPNLIMGRDKNGNTALHIAASRNNEVMAKSLIAKGIDVSIMNNDGLDAVEVAKKSDRKWAGYFANLAVKGLSLATQLATAPLASVINKKASLGWGINGPDYKVTKDVQKVIKKASVQKQLQDIGEVLVNSKTTVSTTSRSNSGLNKKNNSPEIQ